VKIALILPKVFGNPLPYLQKGSNLSVSITRYQISSLIANAFICSFPGRDNVCLMDDCHMGNFNLTRLFEQTSPGALLKIQCIVSYLEQSIEKLPEGFITFSRFCNETTVQQWIHESPPIPYTNTTNKQPTSTGFPILYAIGFESRTGIQNTQSGLVIIDFANKLVGGGFIGKGMVQEEILFTCYPELLIAKLLTDQLGDTEVLCVTGAHKYFEIGGSGLNVHFVEHITTMEEWYVFRKHLYFSSNIYFTNCYLSGMRIGNFKHKLS
jgi:poly(ADP-ribose) glycohydrolase